MRPVKYVCTLVILTTSIIVCILVMQISISSIEWTKMNNSNKPIIRCLTYSLKISLIYSLKNNSFHKKIYSLKKEFVHDVWSPTRANHNWLWFHPILSWHQARLKTTRNLQELSVALQEWNRMPQYKICRLVESMRRRQSVIDSPGGHTRY